MKCKLAWTQLLLFLFSQGLFSQLSIAQSDTPAPSPELLRLSKAIQIETVSSYDSTAIYLYAYKNFIALLQESFPLAHQRLEWDIVNKYSLIYHWKGSNPSLAPVLFLAHYDVVPVEIPTLSAWEQPPFSGHIDEKFIWGRGALDNKSQVLALLETVEKLLSESFLPQQTVYIALGHDEEVGGEQGAAKLAHYLNDKNLQFEFIIDEGGILASNIYPGMKKTVAFIGTAEKGNLNIQLSVQDKGGHSAVPPPETAIDILAKAIIKINADPMPARLQEPTIEMLNILAPHINFKTKFAIRNKWLFRKKILKELSKNAGTNALIRTVMSTTMISGGSKENVLPSFASVNLNVRLLQGDSIESIMQYIRNLINDPRVVISGKKPYHIASPITPSSGKTWDLLAKTIEEVFPGMVVTPIVSPGITDSRHYAGLGKNIFRFTPLLISPDNQDQIHGINERISINDYRQAIRFYTSLIRNLHKEN